MLKLLTISTLVALASALWPLPRSLQTGSTALTLAKDFNIKILVDDTPSDLKAAASRTLSHLTNDKLERLVVGRGSSDNLNGAKTLSTLTLSLENTSQTARSISEEAMVYVEDRDEAYELMVPSDGSDAYLKANSTLGLFRGLTTFSQLWYTYQNETYTIETPIHIQDSPVFHYRGFMLDTARNYFPVSDIKRTLDAMSWVKINTFDWHVVDSQSFPLQISGLMELSAQGAYSATSVYSPDDVKDIVSYAAARGIDVIVEIDTPGHEAAVSQSHPEHVACAYSTPWSSFASEPPAGQLRLASPATINFTTTLFAETAKMFPSKIFSTGGDEVNLNCYAQDEQTQKDLNSTGKTLGQALNDFIQETHAVLINEGKTVVVKQEMLLENNVTLPNNTIIMVWKSSADVKTVAQKGYKLVHAASDYFYLDCGAGEWLGDDPSGNSWCDPFKTWQHSYSLDPTANLTEEESKFVLGGRQLLWTEQTSPANLDPITWPRAASSAELFWTGPGRNVSTALPRLHDIAFRMIQRGINAIPLQPLWCALRPGACDLMA